MLEGCVQGVSGLFLGPGLFENRLFVGSRFFVVRIFRFFLRLFLWLCRAFSWFSFSSLLFVSYLFTVCPCPCPSLSSRSPSFFMFSNVFFFAFFPQWACVCQPFFCDLFYLHQVPSFVSTRGPHETSLATFFKQCQLSFSLSLSLSTNIFSRVVVQGWFDGSGVNHQVT